MCVIAGAAECQWQHADRDPAVLTEPQAADPAERSAADPAGGMDKSTCTPSVQSAGPASQADDVYAYGLILQQLCGAASSLAGEQQHQKHKQQQQVALGPAPMQEHGGPACTDRTQANAEAAGIEYKVQSMMQPLEQVKEGRLPAGRQLPCRFPPSLAWLLSACLAHAPTDRPSFECILQTLEGVVRAEVRE